MRERFIYIFIIIIYMITSCVSPIFISDNVIFPIKLSDDIYYVQNKQFGTRGKICDRRYENFMNNIFKSFRYDINDSKWWEDFNYSIREDTLYLLSAISNEGNHYFSIWNTKDTLTYNKGLIPNMVRVHNIGFTKYIMKLVSEWNINGIRYEERINNSIISPATIYATKIIINNENTSIDCVRFEEFYNLERDRFDFNNTSHK
ncbi:hypothetical protein FACS1894178_6160 [Bacteroidia bacterium]|nr:hypothetical protein FACS1894178_6160 [Bacteroidia bacterium]